MNIAMAIIAVSLMLVAKIGLNSLAVLKARYLAMDNIKARELLELDHSIDKINDPQEQAIKRLEYKVKRDGLLLRSKVEVANAIAEVKG